MVIFVLELSYIYLYLLIQLALQRSPNFDVKICYHSSHIVLVVYGYNVLKAKINFTLHNYNEKSGPDTVIITVSCSTTKANKSYREDREDIAIAGKRLLMLKRKSQRWILIGIGLIFLLRLRSYTRIYLYGLWITNLHRHF